MSSTVKPKLGINLMVPEFTSMRITPPTKLEPLVMNPLPEIMSMENRYVAFPEEIFSKLGVKDKAQKATMAETFEIFSCINSCSTCKTLSKETLMEINSKNIPEFKEERPQQEQNKTSYAPSQKEEKAQDPEKRQSFERIWKECRKRNVKPSIIKFPQAYKSHQNMTEEEWKQKVEEFFK